MRTATCVCIVVFCAAAAGCGQTEADRFVNVSGGAGYDQGLVVCLSGVGGMCGEVDHISRGLIDAGVPCAIEGYRWATGNVLADQMDLAANKAKARALARRIEEYEAEHPGRPVHLFGVSAGTGLVVWALEDLGPGCHVDNVFLIGSSLSSRYDLRDALSRVGGRLYNHYSAVDGVLGALVPATGTVDRAGGDAGGLHGFRPPRDGDGLYGERMSQVAWKPADAKWGHDGGHLGGTQPAYVREYMAPLAWVRVPQAVPEAQGTPPVLAGGSWTSPATSSHGTAASVPSFSP